MGISRIGVDESGKGDYFGPLVIAACHVTLDSAETLKGVKDSKKLTDKKAIQLASIIKSTCKHSIITILPTKYNELYEKFNNLNKLLAWGHARAIENVLELVECHYVISDQFADPSVLRKSLFAKGKSIKVESRTKAEEDLAVAAASILARAEFLNRLEQLSRANKITLPKGAGPQVNIAGKEFLAMNGIDKLPLVAKMHFKTTQKIQE